MKKYLFVLVLLIFLVSCTGNNGKNSVDLPEEKRQWAVSAKASSSYAGDYGQQRDDYSPFAATGQPDVFNCTDNQKAWVTEKENDRLHWLELTYNDEIYVSKVKVRETLGPGSVTKIELKNNTEYFTFWEGQDNRRKKPCPGYFEKDFVFQLDNTTQINMTPFKTDTVKITLDTDIDDWNEIDAVELIGHDRIWYFYNKTLVIK